MPIVELPYFGPLNTGNIEEYYEVEIEMDDAAVQLDLNFEHHSIDEEGLIKVKRFLEKLPAWKEQNQKHIRRNLDDEDDNTVREYAEFILEEFHETDLQELLDMDTDMEERISQITAMLHLVRIGLYPDGANQFAVFDYTIGRDLLDHLVVINTDENGQIDYITMES